MDRLAPVSEDPVGSMALAQAAVRARAGPHDVLEERIAYIEREIQSGRLRGGLWIRGERPIGLALWDPPGPLGVELRISYLVPEAATPSTYRELLDSVACSAGALAFASPLPGLSAEEEAEVLGGLGFAPFSRSEMRFPTGAPRPPRTVPPRVLLRPLRLEDEASAARVHAAAYRDHFDRYLFLEDPDPERDAQRTVSSLLRSRWGEYLPWASFGAETQGKVAGITIVLRLPGQALIADVSVDPAYQRQGIGRALVSATVGELNDRREPVIALAVTEGNRRAIRLYESLGFVRALGPSQRWYSTRRIPIGPGRA